VQFSSYKKTIDAMHQRSPLKKFEEEKSDSSVKDGLLLKIFFFTYSSVLHSHTLIMKVCPCGSYRQL